MDGPILGQNLPANTDLVIAANDAANAFYQGTPEGYTYYSAWGLDTEGVFEFNEAIVFLATTPDSGMAVVKESEYTGTYRYYDREFVYANFICRGTLGYTQTLTALGWPPPTTSGGDVWAVGDAPWETRCDE
jgi:hypothetical protein